jgi:hypothetical protein
MDNTTLPRVARLLRVSKRALVRALRHLGFASRKGVWAKVDAERKQRRSGLTYTKRMYELIPQHVIPWLVTDDWIAQCGYPKPQVTHSLRAYGYTLRHGKRTHVLYHHHVWLQGEASSYHGGPGRILDQQVRDRQGPYRLDVIPIETIDEFGLVYNVRPSMLFAYLHYAGYDTIAHTVRLSRTSMFRHGHIDDRDIVKCAESYADTKSGWVDRAWTAAYKIEHKRIVSILQYIGWVHNGTGFAMVKQGGAE